MRLAFLGTPDAAVPPLRALVAAGHQMEVVVTQPDRKRGRGTALVPSPVKAAATELGLPVTAAVDDVLGLGLELGVVVAYGRIIRPHVLAEVPMVNLHFSLLPRWRGAAPVERAVLAGDVETGVCVMEVEEGLDTGGVYAVERVPVGDQSVDALRRQLVAVGAPLLVRCLAAGLGAPAPQVGEPTYASKVEPQERHLDWSETAELCQRRVRLGRAWTTVAGRRLLVLAAADGEPTDLAPGTVAGDQVAAGDRRSVRLVTVQPEGKGPMTAAAWRQGARPDGVVFGL